MFCYSSVKEASLPTGPHSESTCPHQPVPAGAAQKEQRDTGNGRGSKGRRSAPSCSVQGMPQHQRCSRAVVTAPGTLAATLSGSLRSCLEQSAGRGGATSPGQREGNSETLSNYSLADIILPLLKMTMKSLESTLSPDVCMGHSFSPCPVSCLICNHQCVLSRGLSYSNCIIDAWQGYSVSAFLR